MGLYARKRVILAKVETTYGTDAVPVAGTDAVLLRSINPATPLDLASVERTLVRPFLGQFVNLPVKSLVKLDFEMEFSGFGTAGPATPTPGYAALLRACGLAQTVTAGTKVVYNPVSSAFDSVTIYFYQDGTLHKLLGARGDLEISLPLNGVPVYKLSFIGLYGGVTDVALPSPTISAYVQPVAVNIANTTALSIQGFATARMKNLTLKLKNQLEHRNLVGPAEEVLLTDRKPEGDIEIEATTVAAKDWWTAIRSATLGALSITHGPATNQIKLDAPQVQLITPKFAEDQSLVHLNMGLQLMPSAGNDELTITVQ